MHGCKKCCAVTAALMLLLGVGFLLVDLGIWNFWDVKWWSAVLLLFGLTGLCKSMCKNCCQSTCETKPQQ